MEKYQVGDWVRFYRNGVLVIGEVRYRTKDDILNDYELATTEGAVDEEYVLEGRAPLTPHEARR